MNEYEIKRYITQISNQYWPDKKNIIEYIDNNRPKENCDVCFNSNGFENNLSNNNDLTVLKESNNINENDEEKIEFINDIPIEALNDCFKDDQIIQMPIQKNLEENVDTNDINDTPIEALNDCFKDDLFTQKPIQTNVDENIDISDSLFNDLELEFIDSSDHVSILNESDDIISYNFDD